MYDLVLSRAFEMTFADFDSSLVINCLVNESPIDNVSNFFGMTVC